MSKLIFLLFASVLLSSICCYEQFDFSVQCPQCLSDYQNHTVVGPYAPGLFRISIVINISTISDYEGNGFISGFLVPNFPSSETGYVMNVISNNTQFFNHGNNAISCAGDVKYDYGCVSSINCNSYWQQCSKKGYSSNLLPITSTCTSYPMESNYQVFELAKQQINSNCYQTNVLQKTISENYIPTSGVQMYNQTISLYHNSTIFKAAYIIDSMNYPEFYFDFYSMLKCNNRLNYHVYFKINYIEKYDSNEIENSEITFL